MKLENIEFLTDGNGEVTLGRCGPVRCAATASDNDQCLAMLARRPGESLLELLQRLDAAIEDAYERGYLRMRLTTDGLLRMNRPNIENHV